MPRWIQFLILSLIVLLPWQSVFVIFLTNVVGLSPYLALWKEVVTAIVSIYFLYAIITAQNKPTWKDIFWYPLYGLGLINLWIVGVSIQGWGGLSDFLRGYRFELWWMIPFVLGFMYTSLYKEQLKDQYNAMTKAIVGTFVSVSAFSVFLLLAGQERVLEFLGYGQSSEGVDSVVCHSIDYGVEGCRAIGTFTSPNHFGLYMVLILPVLFASKYKYWLVSLAGVLIAATVSRAAILGLIVVLAVVAINALRPRLKKLYKPALVGVLAVPLIMIFGLFLVPESVLENNNAPTWLGKPSSTVWHSRRTKAALRIIQDEPITGFGLGLMGPAASPIYADLADNDLAQTYMHVVVFQPEEFIIPENWFLQTTVHGGIVYTAVYIAILALPLLVVSKTENKYKPIFLAAYYGLFLSNLVLHTWENQAVALYTSFVVWWQQMSS